MWLQKETNNSPAAKTKILAICEIGISSIDEINRRYQYINYLFNKDIYDAQKASGKADRWTSQKKIAKIERKLNEHKTKNIRCQIQNTIAIKVCQILIDAIEVRKNGNVSLDEIRKKTGLNYQQIRSVIYSFTNEGEKKAKIYAAFEVIAGYSVAKKIAKTYKYTTSFELTTEF